MSGGAARKGGEYIKIIDILNKEGKYKPLINYIQFKMVTE